MCLPLQPANEVAEIVLTTQMPHKKYIFKYILDKLKRFLPLQSQNKRGKKSKAIFGLKIEKVIR